MGIFISILILSALVFFHELGHYLMAKAVGVYIEVFSIGFGKKITSFMMFNTEWRVSIIPLGGYVKMKGQDDINPLSRNTDKDSYNSKTPFQRILILLAGPAANFILAFVLYIFVALGSPGILAPVIGHVLKDSPAFIAGLKSQDIVIAVDNKKISSWNALSKAIVADKTNMLNLTLKRNNHLLHVKLIPKIHKAKNMFNQVIYKPMIGIASAGVRYKLPVTFSNVLNYGFYQTKFASTMIFKSVEKLIVGDIPAKDLGGVISIVKITSNAAAQGWMAVLFFTALISVNLGVLNLLPIPALDGGHIMFNLYEMISKHAPSEAILVRLTMVGWVVLIGLMGLGLYNDINRLVG